MRKKFFLLSAKLPAAISVISVIGSMCIVGGIGIKTLGAKLEEAKAVESPTIIRELTPNEIQRLYLYEQLNYDINDYRILSKIIKCESGWNSTAVNKKTNDFGLFQVNQSIWDEQANELGYNYQNDWRDNISFGIWIYKNSGIQNWNWSKKCWK